jgi:uncharacterized membrane protein
MPGTPTPSDAIATLPLQVARTASRIAAVDAARGCAMLLVFLSHIKHHFVDTAPALHWFLITTTRIATPTFLLLSGFVIRHLMRSDSRGDASITLFDRALFLLIVAHALLGWYELPNAGMADWIFARSMITDAVGVALLVGILLRRAPMAVLAALGAALVLFSWIVATSSWVPTTEWARRAALVLFQLKNQPGAELVDAPIVAYTGLFLLGMALHAHLERPLSLGQDRFMGRRLVILGSSAIVLVLIAAVAWHLSKEYAIRVTGDPDFVNLLRATIDPRTKSPPSPAYALFYTGAGLLFLALFFLGGTGGILDPVRRWASVIGRTSLMCFILQDWLLMNVPAALGLNDIHSVAFWFAYLACTVVLIVLAARVWERKRANRFFTLGLRAHFRRARLQNVSLGEAAVSSER